MRDVLNRKFLSWFLVSMFYAYQYILRVMPNIIGSMSMEKFKISAMAFGQFSGLYYIGYTLAHIPIGIFLDKYGPKIVLPICVVLTIIGLVPLLVSDVWLFSQIGRIITGIGSAGSALGLFKVASMYYDKRFVRMSGISIIIGLLGAMYGGLPVLSLLNKFGWETFFIIFIAVGAVMALLLYICMLPYDQVANLDSNKSLCDKVKLVVFNKYIIIISLLAGFMIGPLEGFADGWVTSFLRAVGNMDKETSALLPSVIFIGVCIGAFILPYILEGKSFDTWNILVISAFGMMIPFLTLYISSSSVVLVTISFFLMGFFSAYQIIATCKVLSYVNDSVVALATAVNNMIVMAFGYFFHTAVSCVIGLLWDGKVMDSEPVYTKALMLKSMLFIPGGLLVGAIGFMYLKYLSRKESK
ncbi:MULTISPECIES: MFS transporter [Ehrlichia]|uniref:Major Facilitator Superfamily protein n=1 Tax=Ehrlichia cf. muris str. EmCRT TaxID=1359167 RepID=A0A0F3ND16_9RICK|nr:MULTISPECIES: MFS transporter [Ehrlichia]KJV65631.1 major Facilitator Superfamily protein [Ehrlichia cf. muris str. EmCRT]OUC04432.1 bicyclomycin resistance protein [Ehrlichia sp. Wisconsin_h]